MIKETYEFKDSYIDSISYKVIYDREQDTVAIIKKFAVNGQTETLSISADSASVIAKIINKAKSVPA